jgi:hypothetical protein
VRGATLSQVPLRSMVAVRAVVSQGPCVYDVVGATACSASCTQCFDFDAFASTAGGKAYFRGTVPTGSYPRTTKCH